MEKEVLIRVPNVCKTYSTGSEQCHAIKNMNIGYLSLAPIH